MSQIGVALGQKLKLKDSDKAKKLKIELQMNLFNNSSKLLVHIIRPLDDSN